MGVLPVGPATRHVVDRDTEDHCLVPRLGRERGGRGKPPFLPLLEELFGAAAPFIPIALRGAKWGLGNLVPRSALSKAAGRVNEALRRDAGVPTRGANMLKSFAPVLAAHQRTGEPTILADLGTNIATGKGGEWTGTQKFKNCAVSSTWVCESTNPGVTARPLRSTTRVAGAISLATSALDPTATMRLPRTATASATRSAASSVMIFPPRSTRSAGSEPPGTRAGPAGR